MVEQAGTGQTGKDWYLAEIVGKGDDISAQMETILAPTLQNSDRIEVIRAGMNGVKVIRVPEDHYVIAHMATGDMAKDWAPDHAASMVDNLIKKLKRLNEDIDAKPIAFANVVDAAVADMDLMCKIAESMARQANVYGVGCVNGESAFLGERITKGANVNGTMISVVPKNQLFGGRAQYAYFVIDGTVYYAFDPQGKPVYLNSDGIGTKTEFRERKGLHHLALEDSLAMKLDDTIKLGARAVTVFDSVEMRGRVDAKGMQKYSSTLSAGLGSAYILQCEQADDRLMGYKPDACAFNVSGTAVSVIDEHRLMNPLVPNPGDAVVVIRGHPNPRSNGITDKRKIMVEMFGQEWQDERGIGGMLHTYLSTPSTMLYRVFTELVDKGLATFNTHMSGGAFDGKLARPLMKQGLYAELDNLFPPSWQDTFFAGARFTSAEVAYAKWPMGNDGVIATQHPDQAIEVIKAHGLEAQVAGKIHAMNDVGKSGVGITKHNIHYGQTGHE